MSTILRVAVVPDSMLMARLCSPKISASNFTTAALALPFSAAARTLVFRLSPGQCLLHVYEIPDFT